MSLPSYIQTQDRVRVVMSSFKHLCDHAGKGLCSYFRLDKYTSLCHISGSSEENVRRKKSIQWCWIIIIILFVFQAGLSLW